MELDQDNTAYNLFVCSFYSIHRSGTFPGKASLGTYCEGSYPKGISVDIRRFAGNAFLNKLSGTWNLD